MDWSPVKLDLLLSGDNPVDSLRSWAARHPRNYVGLKFCATSLSKFGMKKEAVQLLEQVVDLFPFETGTGCAFEELAELQRQLGMSEEEWQTVAVASETLGETEVAIDSLTTLIRLNPPDLASVHYRLAVQLRNI